MASCVRVHHMRASANGRTVDKCLLSNAAERLQSCHYDADLIPMWQEYYSNILKKLKSVGASSKQTDFYV